MVTYQGDDMKNKISPPEWFNLELYNEARKFSPGDWLSIINSRLADIETAKAQKKDKECFTELLYQHLDLLKEGKLGSYVLTFQGREPVVGEANRVIDSPTVKTLRVEVSAPKEHIMNQFEAWLKEKKKETKFNKAFSEIEANKLIDNRILPLLDLTIYETIENISYTNPQLASFLYPDEYDIDRVEKVRNAKRLLLGSITSKEYLSWLYSQRWGYQSNLNR